MSKVTAPKQRRLQRLAALHLPGARARAHAHGARCGARREVCARDSSLAKKWGKASRAGDYAKGVRAKFRYGVARFGQRVFLNFDLTPFASSDQVCF